jgi:hypothetical protein
MYVGNRAYSAIYSHAILQSFWAAQASAQTPGAGQAQSQAGQPDFSLWSEKRIKGYRASLLVDVPPPLGVLDIPSLQLEVPVLEGTDDLRWIGQSGTFAALRPLANPETSASPDIETVSFAG